jgi:hypothetical protein
MEVIFYQVLAYLALPVMLFLAIIKVSLLTLFRGMLGTL